MMQPEDKPLIEQWFPGISRTQREEPIKIVKPKKKAKKLPVNLKTF